MRAILQRHGKIIMAILGVVLMFVFALPTFRGMTNEDVSRAEAGRLNGHKITNDDLRRAQGEIDLLKSNGFFALPQYQLTGEAVSLFGGEDRDQGTYWFLLKEEARKYGASTLSTANFSADITQLTIDDVKMDKYINGAGGRDIFFSCESSLDMVENYLEFLTTQPRSVASLELAADQQLRKIKISVAGFDGAQDWKQSPEPTEDQIKKQFDLYKSKIRTPIPANSDEPPGAAPPEIAGHHYPFGYKYPDRVSVEYLVFNRAKLRATMKLTEADYNAAYEYYRQHPDEFRNTPATASAAISPPSTAPATAAAAEPAIKPWAQVKDELANKQLDGRVDRTIKNLTEQILDRTKAPFRKNTNPPPSEWISYQQIADDIGKRSEYGNFKPEYKTTGDTPLSREELANVEGIGKAIYVLSSEQAITFSFPVLATSVHDLVTLDPHNPLSHLELQLGADGPSPLTDKDDNTYIYRVTKVDKSHDPATIDEVRPQIVDDLKKADAYERRLKQAKDALAKNPDVAALAQALGATLEKPDAFSRIDPDLPPEIRGIRDIVKTAFSLPEPPAVPSATASPKSTILENQDTLKFYAIQPLSVTAATGADFAKQIGMLFREGDPAVSEFLRSYLTVEAIAGRLKYVPDVPFTKPKAAATAAAE